MSFRRLQLYATVLLEEIPTLISVTRWRVCELDGGHEWGEWRESDLLPLGVALRSCKQCGAVEHGHPNQSMRFDESGGFFVPPVNLN